MEVFVMLDPQAEALLRWIEAHDDSGSSEVVHFDLREPSRSARWNPVQAVAALATPADSDDTIRR